MTNIFLQDIIDMKFCIIEVYPNDCTHEVTFISDASIYIACSSKSEIVYKLENSKVQGPKP